MLGLSGCASDQNPDSSGSNARTSVVEVEETSGSTDADVYTTTGPVGSNIIIELPFQAGTGYSWSMSSHSDGLSLVRMDTKSLEKGIAGGPMQAIFTLRVEREGRQTARLELARAWETDSAPARQVEVVVNGGSNVEQSQ